MIIETDKWQKAIDILSCRVYQGGRVGCGNCEIQECSLGKSLCTLQQLVDKEKPIKPIKEVLKTTEFKMIRVKYVCPNCKKDLAVDLDEEPTELDTYCGRCGQKIDWSEYE